MNSKINNNNKNIINIIKIYLTYVLCLLNVN